MKTFLDYGIEIPAGRGGEYDTTCPQCSNQRKKKHARCLSVNIDKQTWNCHHCGWSGGLGKVAQIAAYMHWRKPAYRKPEPKPETTLPEKVVSWFKSRGIELATLIRNKIGYGEIYMPQIEDKTNAISFPYFRGTELVNVKYRDGQKNFRMEAGAERVLYGLNDIAETTIIVEGEIDKLSIEQAGFQNCVSVPDGAPSESTKDYSSKFSFLDSDRAKLDGVKEWIIAVDNDAPGVRLEDELSRRLGRGKCKRVAWPEGCKDANDTLVKCGAEVVAICIKEAQPFPIDGVFSVMELSDKIDRLYENGWEKGVSTGWENVDRNYTVRPGEFTVVTGIPNSGKSNWLDALVVNLASQHGWNIAMFSAENQPVEDHMARLIEKRMRRPFFSGPTERMDKSTLDDGKQWLNDHFSWILPDDDKDWTVDSVLEAAKSLVLRKGIRGLVIDPWNELEDIKPDGMSETQYISMAAKRIRNFGRKHGVHVWVVAHPAKMYRDKEGNYPIPTLYDISGSAHWRNKADNGLCIYRDFSNPDSRVIEVHIQKVRFRQIGKIGMQELIYFGPTATYDMQGKAPPEYDYGISREAYA